MKEHIFRAYDIRGLYPSEINEELVAEVVRGCSTLFAGGTIVVGRDVRIGSPELAGAVIKHLLLNPNYEVIDIGVCSTPLFYFSVNVLGAAGGIMVTASHNPSEWNGLKVVGPRAVMIGGVEVREAIRNAGPLGKGGGQLRNQSMAAEYANFIRKNFSVEKPLQIVCDFGNGSAGKVLAEITPLFGTVTFHFLNELPDGRFPSRSPNPLTPGALDGLKEEVKKTKADLGVAFDADGDRAFFIDETGEQIPAYIIALMLTDQGKKELVAEIQTFRALKNIGYKGVLYESPVGTRFVKEKMREVGAEVSAEYSGHYYFKEMFGSDSGVFALMRVLEVVSRLPCPLPQFLLSIPKCYITEWNIHVANPVSSIEAISRKYEEKYRKADDLEKDKIDGIAFFSRDWFFGMRPSNTEPLLRFYAGARSKEALDDLVREVRSEAASEEVS